MSIRLYNTLSRNVDPLPEPPGPVRMYVCGSTVYQRIHVGNARPFVLGMWLRGWLRERGYDVTLVHNITDVDDKVYAEAAKQGLPSRELSERATGWFFEDTDDLALGRPDLEPRATETIPGIIAFIEQLIATEHAYVANGDVYFSVASFPEYGRLSGAQLEDMVAQETSELKRDQRDFALWKSQKPHEDAAWDSPWGPGRPGWHIECSAMAEKYLGPVFELHGGGNDLRFPHHENELAQSRALGHEFARIWTHNGMLEFTGEKMAKSVGNVVTLREALDEYGRETLLLLFLGAHWRKPMDFSEETLAQAEANAERLRNAFRDEAWRELASVLEEGGQLSPRAIRAPRVGAYLIELLVAATDRTWHPRSEMPTHGRIAGWSAQRLWQVWERWRSQLPPPNSQDEEAARFEWGFLQHELDNDFSTPGALRRLNIWQRGRKLGLLYGGLTLFGLDSLARETSGPPANVRALVEQRMRAKDLGDFAAADELRERISESGWEVRDTAEAPGYRLVPKSTRRQPK